jgi:hypothetical protein
VGFSSHMLLALTPLNGLAAVSTNHISLTLRLHRHDPRSTTATATMPEEPPSVRTWPTDPAITYTDYGLISRERQRRSYASLDGFLRIANGSQAIASDLRPPLPRPGDEAWLSWQRRCSIIGIAALSYPSLLSVVTPLVAANGELGSLTSAFLPTVSILFGALLSLTLSIE